MSNTPKGVIGCVGPVGPTDPVYPSYPGGATGPQGASGSTGPSLIPESLHHELPLPFDGSLTCVKQGTRYGFTYKEKDGGRQEEWIAIFDGKKYLFPKDPNHPWAGFVPAGEVDFPGNPLTDSQALCVAAAHASQRHVPPGGAQQVKAADLYNVHTNSRIWPDFLEDSMDVFLVAGVMMS